MASCLRCGKEVEGKATFCGECLEVMSRTPVKPGSVAMILPRPKNQEYTPQDDPRDAAAKAQLKTLRNTVRWLVVLTVILSLLLLVSTGMLLRSTQEQPDAQPIGKNYTTTGQTQQP